MSTSHGESFHAPVEQELELRPDQAVTISHDAPPLRTAAESLEQLGVNAPLKMIIQASPEKTFFVFDHRDQREPIFPDAAYRSFRATYMLADERFSGERRGGYKGIRTGEAPVVIGRNHLTDKFDYPDSVCSSHFEISSHSDGVTVRASPFAKDTLVIWSEAGTEDSVEHQTVPLGQVAADEPLPYRRFGLAERAHRGEDRSLILGKVALFGVFDGLGGHGDGALAAQTAADKMHEHFKNAYVDGSQPTAYYTFALARLLEDAGLAVEKATAQGGTTGTVTQIIPNLDDPSRPYATWASAGDSRLYHAHMGSLRQITYDEGAGSRLLNCLGQGGRVRQSGYLALQGGDKLVLVSDGITGDKGSDLLSNEEISLALEKRDAQAAADELLRISRKHDDKTVIVVDI